MTWNTFGASQLQNFSASGENPPMALNSEIFANFPIGIPSPIISYQISNHQALVFAHILSGELHVEALGTDMTIIFSNSTPCQELEITAIYKSEQQDWLLVAMSGTVYIFDSRYGMLLGSLALSLKRIYETADGNIVALSESHELHEISFDVEEESFVSTFLWSLNGIRPEIGGYHPETDILLVGDYAENTIVFEGFHILDGTTAWVTNMPSLGSDTPSVPRGFDADGNAYFSYLISLNTGGNFSRVRCSRLVKFEAETSNVSWDVDLTVYQPGLQSISTWGEIEGPYGCLGTSGGLVPWGYFTDANMETPVGLEPGDPYVIGGGTFVEFFDVSHVTICEDVVLVLHKDISSGCSYKVFSRIVMLDPEDGGVLRTQRVGLDTFGNSPSYGFGGNFSEGSWLLSVAGFQDFSGSSSGNILSITGLSIDGQAIELEETDIPGSELPLEIEDFKKGCIVEGVFYYPREISGLDQWSINRMGDPYVDDRDLRNRCKRTNCPPHDQVTLFGEPNIALGDGSSFVGALKGSLPASPGYGWQISAFKRIEHRLNGDLVFYDGSGLFERWIQADNKYFPAHPDNTIKAEKLTDGTIRLLFRDGSILKFDAEDRAETWTDRNGNTLTYHYTTTTPIRLEKIIDSQGHQVLFDYTRADGQPDAMRVKTSSSSTDRVTAYEYYPPGHENEHRLKKVTDPAGETIEYLYDEEHRLSQIKDTRGNVATEFTYYLSDGRVETERNYGQLIHRSYNDTNKSVTLTTTDLETTQPTRVSIFFYDDYRNIVEERHQVDGDILVTKRAYRDPKNPYLLTEEIKPNGARTAYSYSNRGNLLETEDPQGNKVVFSYRENPTTNLDLLTSIRRIFTEDPAKSTETIFVYNGNGDLVEVKDPAGNSTEYGYTSDGLVSWVKDRRGFTTSFGYTGSPFSGATRNLQQITPPTGSARGSVSYSYDDFGNVETVTNSLGSVTMTYDDVDRLTTVLDARNKLTSFTIVDGLLQEILAPANDASGTSRRKTTFTHDDSGRVTEVLRQTSSGFQSRVKYGYDGFSQLIWLERKKSSGVGKRFLFDYDVLGRPTSVTDTLGRSSSISHEKFCKSHSVTSARGIRTVSHFDTLCQLTEIETGSSGSGDFDFSELKETRFFKYDSFGRLKEWTQAPPAFENSPLYGSSKYGRIRFGGSSGDKDGSKRLFEYDKLDRLTKVTFEDGKTTSFDYDSEGNLVRVEDSENKVTRYTYTPDGLLAEVQIERSENVVGKFVYAYDLAGLPVSITYPVETGIVAEFKSSSGAQGWNANGQLLHLRYLKGGVPIREFEFDYDDSGNRTKHVESSAAGTVHWRYSYDYLDRLSKVEKGPSESLLTDVSIYSYDESDNRTVLELPQDLVKLIYSYDDADGIETMEKRDNTNALIFTETFEHDNDGNLTTRYNDLTGVTITYGWDGFNKLVAVSSADVNGPTNDAKQENSYLANGFRRKKKAKSGQVTTEYSAGLSTAMAKAGADTISYVQGHQILGFEKNGEFFFFLTDALGSVRDIVRGTDGAVLQSYDYRENGEKTASNPSGATSDKTWVGGLSVNDDTADSGLYLMGHRHYDSSLGRFISRDPIGFAGGLNLYSYGNSPVTTVDPAGLEIFSTSQYKGWAEAQGRFNEVLTADDILTGTIYVASGALLILTLPEILAAGTWYGGQALWQMGARGVGASLMAAGASGAPWAGAAAAGGAAARSASGKPCPDPVPSRVDPRSLVSRQSRSEMRGSFVKRLGKDMAKNGYDEAYPIDVANVNNMRIILEGHHRTQGAIRAGLKEVPILTHEVSPQRASELLSQVFDTLRGI